MSAPSQSVPSATNRHLSSSSPNWLGALITTAKAVAGIGDCLPIPFVKGLFSTSVVLLELMEKVNVNKTNLHDLAESIVEIMEVMHAELQMHGEASAPGFQVMCEDFTVYLKKIVSDLEKMQHNKSGFRRQLKRYLMASSIHGEIDVFWRRVDDLRRNLTLVAAAGTRLELSSVQARISEIQKYVTLGSEFRSEVLLNPQKTSDSTPFDDDFHSFRLGDLELNLSSPGPISIEGEDHKNHQRGPTIIDYPGRTGGGSVVKTVRVFSGDSAHALWLQSFVFHAKNPRRQHLAQLFGICKSPRLWALVFHEDLISFQNYATALPTPLAILKTEFTMMCNL